MKSAEFFRLPITSSDIHNATNEVKNLVDCVVAASKPYKTECFFIKAFTDTCQVRIDGAVYSVHKNYCYFSINTANVSEKVFVDKRYISKL